MFLQRVIIKNFRSIQNVVVEFRERMLTLVGINESGKTNLLDAISFLSGEKEFTLNDIRNPVENESPILDSCIKFVFALSSDETDAVVDSLSAAAVGDVKQDFVMCGDKSSSLFDFIREKCRFIFLADIIGGCYRNTYAATDRMYTINDDWYCPSENCPEDFEISDLSGKQHLLKAKKFIRLNECETFDVSFVRKTTMRDFQVFFFNKALSMHKKQCPEVLYWKYSDDFLLPSSVNISSFCLSPSTCKPLLAMFELYGIKSDDINSEFEKARKSSKHGVRNLLDQVSKKATGQFRLIWKEYEDIKFELNINGDFIEPGIKDLHNHYELSQRSDGFKRFAAFLLMISFKFRTKGIVGDIIIVDEPDNSIHPSGIKYLRDELIKLSASNLVVVSSHSIFMIDGDCIGRHVIVKKDDEITRIEYATESNFVEEEVLFNALGFSVFQVLNKKNILFEGWRDKKLFMVAMTKSFKKKKWVDKIKSVGIAHARGVASVKFIAPMLELAKRELVVLSDSDEAARVFQKEFNSNMTHGSWFRYDEVCSEVTAVTGEDFIKQDCFVERLKEASVEYPVLADIDFIQCASSNSRMEFVKNYLKGKKRQGDHRIIIEAIKNKIFNCLVVDEIADDYYIYLERLSVIL